MAASLGFLLANPYRDGPVHHQGSNRRTACFGDPDDLTAIPTKMQIPEVTPWIKQARGHVRERINPMNTRRLSQRTGDTGLRQILQKRHAAQADRMDVIDMKNRLLTFLGESTVLAAVAGSLDDLPAQRAGNVHASA